MANVIYALSGVSADGHVFGPDGKSDWSMPDEDLHRVHTEQTRALASQLADKDPSVSTTTAAVGTR
jgi:hypothetical protein